MNYVDNLPREATDKRCQYLDAIGRRCKKKAIIETYVHHNSKLYSRWSLLDGWSVLFLCRVHAPPYDLDRVVSRPANKSFKPIRKALG